MDNKYTHNRISTVTLEGWAHRRLIITLMPILQHESMKAESITSSPPDMPKIFRRSMCKFAFLLLQIHFKQIVWVLEGWSDKTLDSWNGIFSWRIELIHDHLWRNTKTILLVIICGHFSSVTLLKETSSYCCRPSASRSDPHQSIQVQSYRLSNVPWALCFN